MPLMDVNFTVSVNHHSVALHKLLHEKVSGQEYFFLQVSGNMIITEDMNIS